MAGHTILIVDDDPNISGLIGDRLELEGYRVLKAGTAREGLDMVRTGRPTAVLLDMMLPDGDGIEVLRTLRDGGNDIDVLMLTAHGTVEKAVEAIKLGAYDFILKPSSFEELSLRLRHALERQSLSRKNAILTEALSGDPIDPVAESPAMAGVLALARRVAETDATVLVLGESGVGKGVVARWLHQQSQRKTGPFVKVDCTILSEELLASDLFGHERGSFTGAHSRKVGRLEMADGGTVFLDEIGELPLALQPKLLRVIEEGAFERVGGTETLRTNARLIAATNRPLGEMVKNGTFRKDLYYRINVMAVEVPPLRERPEDIVPLAWRVLNGRRIGARREITAISKEGINALQAYSWPGNVRELQNVVERAMILTRENEITLESLPPEIQPPMDSEAVEKEDGSSSMEGSVREFKRRLVLEAIRASGGNKADAARRLGISRTYLFRLMEQLGVGGGSEGQGRE
jgi:DNA-binding NtrC family response regulator